MMTSKIIRPLCRRCCPKDAKNIPTAKEQNIAASIMKVELITTVNVARKMVRSKPIAVQTRRRHIIGLAMILVMLQ